jgi:hypothetical protein
VPEVGFSLWSKIRFGHLGGSLVSLQWVGRRDRVPRGTDWRWDQSRLGDRQAHLW